jgi:hypothetical protein
VFLELMNSGKLAVTVDCIKTGDLLKLLDTVVIKLEGGTDEDLAILEQEYTGSDPILFYSVLFQFSLLF